MLRTGRAGSNTTADHIVVTDLALAQIPDASRHGTPILVSADGAGATKDWLLHLLASGRGRAARHVVLAAAVVAAAPAMTALAMIGELTTEHDGPFPRWAEALILVGALGVVALLCLHWLALKRRR